MDCIVVGGGSAGAMAALALARAGIEVELYEERSRGRAGAGWHDDVERGLLSDLGLDPPSGVVVHEPPRFIMTTRTGSPRHVLDPHPAMALDMPVFCAWLLDQAEGAGATLHFETRARIGSFAGRGRVVDLPSGRKRAKVVVDARGLGRGAGAGTGAGVGECGARLHPAIDVCDAHQAVFVVSNKEEAAAFMRKHGLGNDDVVSIAGVEGGYSVLHVSVSLERRKASVLGGAQPFPGRRTGRRIVEDFVSETSWLGERVSGGGSLIPLRQTSPSLVDDGLVRLGDAAGQVFPVTGSGVALHLRAATMAAAVIARTVRLGHPTNAERLWPYNLEYQRGLGAVTAAYGPLRYVLASLTAKEARLFLEAGVVGPDNIRAGYLNELYSTGLSLVFRLLPHLPALLRVRANLANALVRSALLVRHYRHFPKSPAGLERWSRWEAVMLNPMREAALARIDRNARHGAGR